MKVYKFGGASVRDARGIKNLTSIVSREESPLLIVVSALGKTTNALEKMFKKWYSNKAGWKDDFDNIYSYHQAISGDLFPTGNSVKSRIDNSFSQLRDYLLSGGKAGYDYEYDQIVSYGEIWSTLMIAEYLNKSGLNARWIDIRGNLLTDDRFRDANILWNKSRNRIKTIFDFREYPLYITQGFIASTIAGQTTTLGREGSDYTAAILANILDAEYVTLWKDVPGLLNADPRWLIDAEILEEVSYKEAVEMTFSGAKIIHPKTIKPLHNKNIPLHIKSFMVPDGIGTIVKADATLKKVLPVYVRKENQILISLLPKDFSFVMGETLSRVFYLFMNYGIKVNLVEASAVSINVCVDRESSRLESMLADFRREYDIIYNEPVEMLSVRHYTPQSIERIISGYEVLIEQKTRSTVRFVARKT
ncbi:MAG: aspartate kinase [Bacteroidales bacterium]|jgi:aspartate kinase